MVSTNRPTAALGTIAALAFVLAGCTGGDEPASDGPSASASPSPTASPTPTDPAEAAEAERVDAALKRYEEYREIDERHQIAGTNGYDDVAIYLGDSEMLANERTKWEFLAERGYKLVGHRAVTALVDSEYDGDPLANTISGHRVRLDLCVDGSDAYTVDADGDVVPVSNPGPSKVIVEALMQGQPGEQWALREHKSTKKAC
ncbi:hypothetical protein [Promicromonospora sp. NPDC057488]|uniref:hypothetical protein n=1 Tax=Promicromonospora sp. NPDC057488 TaxID=3346147 RepID=UPI00366C4536